ncbi:hypothetical protein [Vreelandella neptunia]|uniref:Uncharacterized protein n=1 Tax=Vreelandella neptunia TaxID=115551 RepID=A0ABZ0YRI4_9GAMM|nr:hypothetical protein [Halomonas neptunia]MDN3561686.1 hypothetical protein [Halomonas neptunia]WQH14588.1 hypothetical protein SR894_08625 [Halomonas neptunia]
MIHLLKGTALQGQLPSPTRPGINPIFKARIHVEGESRRCFIKLLPDHVKENNAVVTNQEAYSEAIGYALARACGFKVANTAGVILLTRKQIPLEVLKQADEETAGPPQSEFIAWFSEDMCFPDLVVQHTTGIASEDLEERIKSRIAKDLLKRKDLPKLVSFDEWTLNTDRNPGNVLSASSVSVALIDHGRLFTSRGWQSQALRFLVHRQAGNQMASWAELGEPGWNQKLPNMSERALAYNGFNISFSDTGQGDVSKALSDLSLPGDEIDCVLDFLEQRLDPAHYRKAIGLIA